MAAWIEANGILYNLDHVRHIEANDYGNLVLELEDGLVGIPLGSPEDARRALRQIADKVVEAYKVG